MFTYFDIKLPCMLHAQLLHSCPILCDPVDCSPPGSSVRKFSRKEHWSGLLCLPPRDLPDPGFEPTSPISPPLQADSSPTEPSGKP